MSRYKVLKESYKGIILDKKREDLKHHESNTNYASHCSELTTMIREKRPDV